MLTVAMCTSWSWGPVSHTHTHAVLTTASHFWWCMCSVVHTMLCAAGADQRPSQRDLNHVGVTAEWRQLGVELGVSTVTLDEVEYDHKHGGIREVRSKMFEAWLKEGDQQQVTWRTLIRALEQIGLADKAEAVVVDNDLWQ